MEPDATVNVDAPHLAEAVVSRQFCCRRGGAVGVGVRAVHQETSVLLLCSGHFLYLVHRRQARDLDT